MSNDELQKYLDEYNEALERLVTAINALADEMITTNEQVTETGKGIIRLLKGEA